MTSTFQVCMYVCNYKCGLYDIIALVNILPLPLSGQVGLFLGARRSMSRKERDSGGGRRRCYFQTTCMNICIVSSVCNVCIVRNVCWLMFAYEIGSCIIILISSLCYYWRVHNIVLGRVTLTALHIKAVSMWSYSSSAMQIVERSSSSSRCLPYQRRLFHVCM